MGEPDDAGGRPVVLFDGECNLCTGAVSFVLRHDDSEIFRFAPLQSGRARELLGEEMEELETFVVLEQGEVYMRSAAAIKLLDGLGGPWLLLASLLRLVPPPIRDLGYRLVARYRYPVFGRKDSCMVPDTDVKDRFLDW